MMNERAREIGMNDTNFVTASGLDSGEHFSTAYDMALLACESISNPEFAAVCSSKTARLTYGNPPYARTLRNHNRLLWSDDSVIGIKTGFTKKKRPLPCQRRREGRRGACRRDAQRSRRLERPPCYARIRLCKVQDRSA